MVTPKDADVLKSISEKLYVAVLSDVLDEIGYRNQALPVRIRPLDDALVMAGHARTGLYRDVYHTTPGETLTRSKLR